MLKYSGGIYHIPSTLLENKEPSINIQFAGRFAELDLQHLETTVIEARGSMYSRFTYLAVASSPVVFDDGKIKRYRAIVGGYSESEVIANSQNHFRECELAFVRREDRSDG